MQVILNLEVVQDLEFHHQYIAEQIEKFTLTPILCNHCNNLSKHFLHPSFYTNELYLRNSRWVLNSDSKLTLDMHPYNQLTFPIYDIRNIKISHPSDRPMGKFIYVGRQVILRKRIILLGQQESVLSPLCQNFVISHFCVLR